MITLIVGKRERKNSESSETTTIRDYVKDSENHSSIFFFSFLFYRKVSAALMSYKRDRALERTVYNRFYLFFLFGSEDCNVKFRFYPNFMFKSVIYPTFVNICIFTLLSLFYC